MGRAKAEKTKYPGVFRRKTSHGTVYDIYYCAGGRRFPPIRGKFTNLEAAHRHRLALIHEAHHGVPLEGKPKTLGQFIEEDWLPNQEMAAQLGNLRSSTVYQRRRDASARLIPTLGDKPLRAVGVREVEAFQRSLVNEGLSNHTVRRIIVTLGTVLEQARRYKLIPANPVADVQKPPARRGREPLALTVQQVRKLADAAPSDDERNLILVAAFTGARIGELFALRWPNVDLDSDPATLLIQEQFYAGEVVERPKTQTGQRRIILAPQAVEALRAQHAEGRPSPLALVFPSPDGTHWRASNFNRRQWKQAREKAGLNELHFHDLRHFYVSHVRGAGLPTAMTKQLTGHSDEKTHDSYTYALPGTETLVRDALGAAFGGAETA